MSEEWGDAAFVRRSDYRIDVVWTLADDPSTPTEIAERHGRAQPHVSRALAELREHGLVELLVPEAESRGRYYGSTEDGRDVLGFTLVRVFEREGDSHVAISFAPSDTICVPEAVEACRPSV